MLMSVLMIFLGVYLNIIAMFVVPRYGSKINKKTISWTQIWYQSFAAISTITHPHSRCVLKNKLKNGLFVMLKALIELYTIIVFVLDDYSFED